VWVSEWPEPKRQEVPGAKRGENEAVLVLGLEPSKKGELFCHGEVFFLLTSPLMGDAFVFYFSF